MFIIARIASIFVSSTAVHMYDFHVFKIMFCNNFFLLFLFPTRGLLMFTAFPESIFMYEHIISLFYVKLLERESGREYMGIFSRLPPFYSCVNKLSIREPLPSATVMSFLFFKSGYYCY